MWLALSMWIDCGAVPSTPELRLPPRDGPLAPSAIRFVGSGGALGDIATCSGCHPDQAAGWSTSAHAHASFDNPWYRASVEALRDEVGRPASRHCAGCHDPVLLATGAIEGEVDPADEAARIGVTCLVCHAVTEVTPDGNASLVVDLSDLPLPDPLEREGPRVEAHRARLRPAELASGAVCGACHRGFLDARTGNATFVSGLDDLGAHAASAYRGSRARRVEPAPVARADCVSCHFDGHRFLGGQTALATATGQVDAVTRRLAEAVTVYAHAWTDGSDLVVDAMVHNSGTGHTFPGGLADAQDSWLALEVEGADGERLVTIDDPADPRAHRVRAEVLDETGQPERQHRPHRIGLVAWDHRVAAGDARVFRTRVLGGAGASRVRVVLHHRPHPVEMQAAACGATTVATLTGCGPIPDVRIGEAEAIPDAEASFAVARVRALGLLHQVSEHLEEARAPIERALAAAPDERSQAAVLVMRGRLEGRLLRTVQAQADFDRAETLLGHHPAVLRGRGEAWARSWQWDRAAEVFARLAEQAPGDTASWRDLAKARMATGDARGTLAATAEGLRRAPRDAELLRQQALAADAVEHPEREEAWAAWMAHRGRDDLADRRAACDRDVAGCAVARWPVPVQRVSVRPAGSAPVRPSTSTRAR